MTQRQPGLDVSVQLPVQLADYTPGSSFGPRRLPTFEFVWLLAGSATLVSTAGDADASVPELLRPGQLVLTRQGECDHYRWDPEQPSRHAYVHFEILQRGHLGEPADWPRCRLFSDAPVLEALCDYLLVLAGQHTASSKRRSDEVIAMLLDLFVTGPFAADQRRPPPPLAEALERVRAIWQRDGMRLVAVGEMAAAAHVSVAHLHRMFTQEYGCSPARSLELVRLGQAAVALQRSNSSVAEVARRCGYRDQFHFGRRFRHLYGVPPSQFRRSDALVDPQWPQRQYGLHPLAQLLLGRDRSVR